MIKSSQIEFLNFCFEHRERERERERESYKSVVSSILYLLFNVFFLQKI